LLTCPTAAPVPHLPNISSGLPPRSQVHQHRSFVLNSVWNESVVWMSVSKTAHFRPEKYSLSLAELGQKFRVSWWAGLFVTAVAWHCHCRMWGLQQSAKLQVCDFVPTAYRTIFPSFSYTCQYVMSPPEVMSYSSLPYTFLIEWSCFSFAMKWARFADSANSKSQMGAQPPYGRGPSSRIRLDVSVKALMM
jgi:hypothetical protein